MTEEARHSYRPEIDGLRALAVLPVILYHLSPDLVPAGFLGVDVFFVISGFLITRLLMEDLRGDRFSLLTFYERRARRILPALFVVIAASVLPAAWLMLPGQHADFGTAILAAIAFVSNVLYYASTGYFLPSSELMPLLHTWSLAVEEQFYLFYPVILFGTWRLRPRLVPWVVLALGIASFVVCVRLARSDPAAGFYLLPGRGWELMAGAQVALIRAKLPRPIAEVASLAGLAMIGAGYALLGDGFVLPSWPTLLPVGGAALFLWGGATSSIGRIVAMAPLRAVGLISYGAYLWHWPLLAFWRLHGGTEMSADVMITIVVTTLALANLTYLFVERPIRRRGASALIPVRSLAPLLGTGAVALCLFGVMPLLPRPAGTGQGGLDAAAIEARLATNFGLADVCEGTFTLDPACRTRAQPEILLWGDSFAMHLAPAIRASGDWGGLIQMTKSSCAPILGLSTAPVDYPADWYVGCLRFNDEVLAWLAGAESVRIVVLSSTFNILFNDLRRPGGATIPAENAGAAVRAGLLDTVERIRAMGKQVVVVSPTPTTGDNIGQCLATNALANGAEDACDFAVAKSGPTNLAAFEFLRGLSDQVPLIDLAQLICPDGTCDTRRGDVFIYRDEGHLSIEGSAYLGQTYHFDRMIRLMADSEVAEIN